MTDFFGLPGVSLGHLHAALLHSLWQGILVIAVVFLLLRRIPVQRPNLRYGVAVAGLLGIVLLTMMTWYAFGYFSADKAVSPLNLSLPAPSASVGPENAGETASPSPSRAQPFVPVSFSTPDYLLCAWLAGVALMMIRVLRLMLGTRKLYSGAHALDDPRTCAILEDVKSALRLSRRAAVLVAEGLVSPVAMGLFWPVVLLPASMVTGLTAEQLRAVLAHELAHIRRYDYLVNFIQLIIEALLYFNPAVWWLSRQIRIEREACCDATAARVLGGPADYAEALAVLARRIHGLSPLSAAVQGLADEGGRGGLLDRVRRLLLPGYWPKLRLRWYSVAMGALVTLAVLFGLYQSSALSVVFASWFLSDAQRIAIMQKLDNDHGQPWRGPELSKEHVEISGVLIPLDGRTLPETSAQLPVITLGDRIIAGGSLTRKGSQFQGQVAKGDIYIFAEFPGYAPTAAGPLHGDAQHPIENVEICLKPSVPATLRFLDPDGRPVAGADATGYYKYLENTGSWTFHKKSDEAGSVSVDQAEAPIPMDLTVKADGFQQARNGQLLLKQGETFDWVLQPDEPIAGIVVDRRSGEPIPGAEVDLVYERGGGFRAGANGESLCVTGADGRFVLRGLNRERTYYFLVRANGYGGEVITSADLETSPVRVALGPRYVRGVIRGDLSQLKQGKNNAGPVISSGMEFELRAEHSSFAPAIPETPVLVKDGLGHFQIDDLRAGDLHIYAGSKSIRVPLREPVEDLVIDVGEASPKQTRSLSIRFSVPEGAPRANGTVGIEITDEAAQCGLPRRSVAVVDGQAETTLETPARLRLYVDGLSGYIPQPQPLGADRHETVLRGWEVPAGNEPYSIEIPLERAGAIYGRVLKADGTPAAKASIYARVADQGTVQWPQDYLGSGSSNLGCNEQGEFAVMPLPLGKTIEITASIAFSRRIEKIRLTNARPIDQVEWRLPEGVDVPVRVLRPDGRPAADTALQVDYPGGGMSGLRTDSEGRYVLCGVNPRQEYSVRAEPRTLYQYGSVMLAFDGRENVIRLEDGLGVEGVILIEGSEKPVPNYPVEAAAAYDPQTRRYTNYRVETVTDNEGRFRFTNLCPGTFTIVVQNTRDFAFADMSEEARSFTAGQQNPVVIRLHPQTP